MEWPICPGIVFPPTIFVAAPGPPLDEFDMLHTVIAALGRIDGPFLRPRVPCWSAAITQDVAPLVRPRRSDERLGHPAWTVAWERGNSDYLTDRCVLRSFPKGPHGRVVLNGSGFARL